MSSQCAKYTDTLLFILFFLKQEKAQLIFPLDYMQERVCYWPCGPDSYLKFSLLCRTVQNLCVCNRSHIHAYTHTSVSVCFTRNLFKLTFCYLLNIADERPDNLPLPDANETEIKVETLTGNDIHLQNFYLRQIINPSGFTPDPIFSWNGHGNNVSIVTL